MDRAVGEDMEEEEEFCPTAARSSPMDWRHRRRRWNAVLSTCGAHTTGVSPLFLGLSFLVKDARPDMYLGGGRKEGRKDDKFSPRIAIHAKLPLRWLVQRHWRVQEQEEVEVEEEEEEEEEEAPSSTKEEKEEEEEEEVERPRAEDSRPAEMTGSGREERQEASREQGPLADMQAQDEQPCWGPARRREAAVEAEDIRRVAQRLTFIGDQINTTVLFVADAAPQWRYFRTCLHLLNFVSQALNNLYHFR
ncbi:unnamed protein product [Boreogadus saida]